MWESLQAWFLSFGQEYGVNPVIFGAIYVGAIPFFTLSIAWLVRNKRAGKSIVLPVLSAGCFFVSAYVYLAIAGKNIPEWVWIFLGALIVYGTYSTVKSVRSKISDADGAAEPV
jgi:O-antigen/teichoic acid export membrane protein